MISETVQITGQGVSLSLISWRRHKRRRAGYVEQMLDLNPGVADMGAHLPVGTRVVLPIDPIGPPADEEAIALWD